MRKPWRPPRLLGDDLQVGLPHVRADEAHALAPLLAEPAEEAHPERLSEKQQGRLAKLLRCNLKTVRSYLLKEDFQFFWGYVSPYWAGRFLDRWRERVMRSQIEPMKKVVAACC